MNWLLSEGIYCCICELIVVWMNWLLYEWTCCYMTEVSPVTVFLNVPENESMYRAMKAGNFCVLIRQNWDHLLGNYCSFIFSVRIIKQEATELSCRSVIHKLMIFRIIKAVPVAFSLINRELKYKHTHTLHINIWVFT